MNDTPVAKFPGVAVIGMACRFPGADTPEGFWRHLEQGDECLHRFSLRESLEDEEVDPELLGHLDYVPVKGLLRNADLFDPHYFGISEADARVTDPQHRLLLDCAAAAMDDAGYGRIGEATVGVFAGASTATYWHENLLSNPEVIREHGPLSIRLGNDKDFLASRISYLLGLDGPSVGVSTACSTSLAAVHLACESIKRGECDLAIAGGVTVSLPLSAGYRYERGGILAPDGVCRAHGAGANGTVPGDGVGVVVLKRCTEAVRDRDHIYAVIRGTAMNNDGNAKIGFTAPSQGAHERVIADALRRSAVERDSVSYLETHGTGTPIGDSLELAALLSSYGPRSAGHPLFIGSVKANVGHLDAAAGIAGLVKAILAVRQGVIPPHLAAADPASPLAQDESVVRSAASAQPWPPNGTPRRAAVSSLGMGGTNVHAIIEEAPARPGRISPETQSGPYVLPLSGRTRLAVQRQAEDLVGWLAGHPGSRLADVAFTLQKGRREWDYRAAVVCADPASAAAGLRGCADSVTRAEPGADGSVFFVFGGGASSAVNDLLPAEPAYREAYEAVLSAARALDPALALTSGQWPAGLGSFAEQYALAQLFISRGVRPAAVIGQGIGECVAGCLSGVLSLESALTIIGACGRPGDLAAFDADAVVLAGIPLSPPGTPLISVATGCWVTPGTATAPDHWVSALTSRQRWLTDLSSLLAFEQGVLMEFGPDAVIPEPARRVLGGSYPWLSASLDSADGSARRAFLDALAAVWALGVAVCWDDPAGPPGAGRVPLPPYPTEPQRYWITSARTCGTEDEPAGSGPADTRPAETGPAGDGDLAELTELLSDAIGRVLGVAAVRADDSFLDLGGDSLLGTRLISQLDERYGIDLLDVMDLFEFPTPAELADVLRQRMEEQLSALRGRT
jgi:phthiocerol/phenolphthiocerol synthesis type-I polyketide synthase E